MNRLGLGIGSRTVRYPSPNIPKSLKMYGSRSRRIKLLAPPKSEEIVSEQPKTPIPVAETRVEPPKGIGRRKWSRNMDRSKAARFKSLVPVSWKEVGTDSTAMLPVRQQKVLSPLGGKLERPMKIRKALAHHQFAIVAGPGYTGKTEQIDLAIPGRTSIDIKTEYLRDKFHGKIPDEAWDHYEEHKAGEAEWLINNIDRLIEKFGTSESDTVAIDEADYYGIDSELIVLLIKGLQDRGKQVVLILHPEGLKSHDFFAALAESGIYEHPDEQLIQTGWYSHEEQLGMLSAAGYEPEEALKIVDCVQGNPTAYVGILKDAQRGALRPELRLPVDEFLRKAKANTEKMIDISMQSGDFPTAIRLMSSPVVATNVTSISSHVGLMGMMMLRNQQRWQAFGALILLGGAGLPVDRSSRFLIDHWMSKAKHLDQMHQCLESAALLGLDTRLMRCSQGHVYLVGDKQHIDPLQRRVLGRIGQEISARSLHTEASLPAYARHWWELHSNSAKTIDQLQSDAKQSWPTLKSLAQGVADQFSGVVIDAGPGDIYALKGAKRMQEKVDGYRETGLSEEEAVGQLTDPVRVSIVIGEESSASYADVAEALNTALADNPDIHFHVCMNKFENSDPKSNPMAYGAVHVVAVLKNPDGSRVFAELQVHKEQPLKVKNGAMHQLYELTRAAGTPEDTRLKGMLSQQLLSSVAHWSTLPSAVRGLDV